MEEYCILSCKLHNSARFTNEVSYLRLMNLFNVQWVKLTLHYQNMCVLQDPWY